MKLMKKIVLSLLITLSSLGISSVAHAGPAEAINNVSAKIAEASAAIDNGASSNDVMLIIKQAALLVGEIQIGDNIVSKRQRANAVLKKARIAAKKGKLEDSKKHLEAASQRFSQLKSLL